MMFSYGLLIQVILGDFPANWPKLNFSKHFPHFFGCVCIRNVILHHLRTVQRSKILFSRQNGDTF